MKKTLVVVFASFLLATTAEAQFDRIKNRIKDRVNQKVNEKIDQKVDETVDEAMKAEEEKKKQEAEQQKQQAEVKTETKTEVKADVKVSTPVASIEPKMSLKSYAKFDFIPATNVLFEDNIIGENTDEIPSLWVPEGGKVEIVKIDGQDAIGLLDGFYTRLHPRMKSDNYLTERFTIEFDYLIRPDNGKNGFKEYLAYGAGANFSVNFCTADKDCDEAALGSFYKSVEFYNQSAYKFGSASGVYPAELLEKEVYDKWVHVSITGTEKNLKVYVNNQRVLNAPIEGGKAASFSFNGDGCTAGESHQIFLRNIRVAAGGEDPYKQLTTAASPIEAKFIARGINFDYGKATIRPESMGELNRIQKMMTDHLELKFEIGGHTDSDGSDALNLKLSQDRATAVQAQLVSMGIKADRFTAKGYGETAPISENTTVEGKANNRRVEFTKM